MIAYFCVFLLNLASKARFKNKLMLTDIHPIAVENLNRTPIVQQTAYWSAVKSELGYLTLAVEFKSSKAEIFGDSFGNETITADLLVIIQHIDAKHSVAYVPYGPEIEPKEENQGAFLEELSESLRPFLPANCIMIRYDLHWESYWSNDSSYFDQEGSWEGPPEIAMQELRFNMSTTNWNFRKSFHNILPSNTVYLDLKPSSETLMARMKPKTRYNIKLAYRKGVSIRTVGMENLEIWYKLYKETAIRNHIFLNDIKYFEVMLTAKMNDARSPAEVNLLVAEIDGMPLAAMFLVISLNRAYYLYGASSSSNRNAMATYALQWEAIQIAKSKGCVDYDMFGVAPRPDPHHPLYGLYKFKLGFGGKLYHSIGSWDYPLNGEQYNRFVSMELNGKGYHLS
jgi:lipid II:glycine glycyltransferase (peptidoglycan interpeptide bridge formation enzyme)